MPGTETRWRRGQMSVAVVAADALVIMLGFGIGHAVRPHDSDGWSALVVTLAIYVAMALNMHAFSVPTMRRPGAARLAVRALFLSYAALALLLYTFRAASGMSRTSLLVGMAVSLLLLAVVRRIVDRLVCGSLNRWLWTEIVVLDRVRPSLPPSTVCIDARSQGIAPDPNQPAGLDRFAALVREADRVVIACPAEARAAWSMMLKGANVHGEVMVDDIAPIGAFGMSMLADHTTLVVANGPLTLTDRFVKRAFDLILCVPALIILAPVLLLTALAIKLDSRGPVFFRQRRVGRGNAFFEIVKFRSMDVAGTDIDGTISTRGRGDRRITRVGRLIRSTSIDELPQLFNVLTGSMSLVGPRPHALGSMAGSQLFWEVDDRYWHRHACKPGLTGLAQVRGFRGATHRREDLVNRLQADLEYLNGWTIWRDISIVISTGRVLIHRNAF